MKAVLILLILMITNLFSEPNVTTIPEATRVKFYFGNYPYLKLNSDMPILTFRLASDLDKIFYKAAPGNLRKLLNDASGAVNTPINRVFYADANGAATSTLLFNFNGTILSVPSITTDTITTTKGISVGKNIVGTSSANTHFYTSNGSSRLFIGAGGYPVTPAVGGLIGVYSNGSPVTPGDVYISAGSSSSMGVDGSVHLSPRMYLGPAPENNNFQLKADSALIPILQGNVITRGTLNGATPTEIGRLTGLNGNAQTQLDNKQPLDGTLTALAALDASKGVLYQTGADAFTKYSITTSGNTICGGEDLRLTDSRNPTPHAHPVSNVTGLADSLALRLVKNNAITGSTNTKITYDYKGLVTGSAALVAIDIPALDWSKITTGKPNTLAGYGITDATLNYDNRLSDSRTPLAHTQDWSTITGKPSTFVPSTHASTHATAGSDPLYNQQLNTNSNVAFNNVTTNGFTEVQGELFLRSSASVLNKSLGGWLSFMSRNTSGSEVVYDLSHIGTINGVTLPTSIVSGTGTINYLPKWTSTGTTQGNSIISDDGSTATTHGNQIITGSATAQSNKTGKLIIDVAGSSQGALNQAAGNMDIDVGAIVNTRMRVEQQYYQNSTFSFSGAAAGTILFIHATFSNDPTMYPPRILLNPPSYSSDYIELGFGETLMFMCLTVSNGYCFWQGWKSAGTQLMW